VMGLEPTVFSLEG